MNFADRAHGRISRARFCFRDRRREEVDFSRHGESTRSRRRLHSAFCLLISGLCSLTSGCFRHEAPANVTIVNGNEPESLDPHIVTGVSEMRLTKALFDGLTKLEPTNAT